MPTGVKSALNKSFQNLQIYPDIRYKNLKNVTAEYLGCNSDNILLGNGAVEIIDNFCAADFNRVIIFQPCFSEYELRAKIRNKDVIKLRQNDDFSLNVDTLKNNINEKDLIILGNPNNPTGLRIEKNILLQIYEIITEKNAFLLLDEAFFEFCDSDYDSIAIFKNTEFKNVCIIRAATKFFALPGIRLAYACTAYKRALSVAKFEQPWHINACAETAAHIILTDKSFIMQSRLTAKAAYSDFFTNLHKHKTAGKIKFEPYRSDCNFILLKLLNCTDSYAQNFFEKKGILIRTCSSFETLGNNHIRVAVKLKKDNDKFIESLG